MPSSEIQLSVVIITKNEEKNIERCLSSVQEVADEIVIVDSFSTDKTEEICLKYHTKFIKHAFEGHIQQKNYAVSQASYPYILSLDADEVLSEKLKASIISIKNNWQFDGYYVNRLTNYCGHWIRHSGWYPDRKLRLWDSRKGKWGGVNPHDKFIMQDGSKTSQLKGDLLHYSINSIEHHIEIVNSFSSIAAKAKFEQGKKAGLWHIIVHPAWKFLRNYLLKAGFLDGFYGFVICSISAHATFLRYVKLRKLHQEAKKNI